MSTDNQTPSMEAVMEGKELTAGQGKSPILRFFAYKHLPERLHGISMACATLADAMEVTLPPGAEKSAGLRKLLEAKDCFVRAALP